MEPQMSIVFIVIALALSLAGAAHGAGSLPPQCDPMTVMYPKSIMFMGPAKFIQVGTVNFSYHDFGPFDSPNASDLNTPVVMVNGFGATQYDWPLDLLNTLAAQRRVVTVDTPRMGASIDTSQANLTIDYIANATLGFIQALGVNRPDIVGYSMGGDIALTLAALHGAMVGGVASIAGSFGGKNAPQPPGGLGPVLQRLTQIFLNKYNSTSATSLSSNTATAASKGSTPPPPPSPLSAADLLQQEYKLLFPLGWYDPAVCNLVHDFISLEYAVRLLPLDNYTGYALPGGVFPTGIIPSLAAMAPTPSILQQQTEALLQYHSSQNVGLQKSLYQIARQVLFVGGVQDNVIPSGTQLTAVGSSPGAWLLQATEAGHGLPFMDPTGLAGNITTFFATAQDISPTARSYYQVPATSGSIGRGSKAYLAAAACVTLALAMF